MRKICKRCGKSFDGLSWDTLCFKCQKKRDLERIQKEIADAVNTGEDPDTWSSDYAICPYCGNPVEQLSYDETPEMYDEGDHEVECYQCGRHFRLTTSVSYSWETEKIKEDK